MTTWVHKDVKLTLVTIFSGVVASWRRWEGWVRWRPRTQSCNHLHHIRHDHLAWTHGLKSFWGNTIWIIFDVNIWLYRDWPPTASWINGNFFKLWAAKQCENSIMLIALFFFSCYHFCWNFHKELHGNNCSEMLSCIQPHDLSLLNVCCKQVLEKTTLRAYACFHPHNEIQAYKWSTLCESEGLLLNTRKHLILHSQSSLCFTDEAVTKRRPKEDLLSRRKLTHSIISYTHWYCWLHQGTMKLNTQVESLRSTLAWLSQHSLTYLLIT